MNSFGKQLKTIFADGFSFPPLSADRRLLLTQRTPNFYSRLFTSSLASQCAETSLSRLRLCLTFTGGECQRCRWRHATPISSRAEAMGKLGFCWIFGYLHRGSRELIGGWVKDGLIWFKDEGALTFHLSLDNVKSLECLWNAFSLSGPFLYKKNIILTSSIMILFVRSEFLQTWSVWCGKGTLSSVPQEFQSREKLIQHRFPNLTCDHINYRKCVKQRAELHSH